MTRVRHAEPRDAAGWAALRAALWPDEDAVTHRTETERFFAEPPRGAGAMPEAVLVAEAPGDPSALVGFAEVSRRAYAEGCTTSPVGFLEGWYVVPTRRGQGVGRALVLAAEAWARGLGCREFASDARADNAVSAAAHRALGFEEVEVIRCFRKALAPGAATRAALGSEETMTHTRRNISSGSPFEPRVGISRAVRLGPLVTVAGTAPLGADGRTVGRGDPAAQARRCLEVIGAALEQAGASLGDVVRTRILLTRIEDWEAVAGVHGEVFGEIRPANTIMQVSRFIDPEWLVEIEADAVVPPDRDA